MHTAYPALVPSNDVSHDGGWKARQAFQDLSQWIFSEEALMMPMFEVEREQEPPCPRPNAVTLQAGAAT